MSSKEFSEKIIRSVIIILFITLRHSRVLRNYTESLLHSSLLTKVLVVVVVVVVVVVKLVVVVVVSLL